MEEDLNKLKTVTKSTEFLQVIDAIIGTTLTPDFWSITLPSELESSSPRNPAFLGFQAAQCLLAAPVLFSDKKVSDILDPALRPARKAIDRHHLFPKGWLQKNGVTDSKAINQVANFAYVEWPENLSIKAASPRDYVPKIRAGFSDHSWIRMLQFNALPEDWERMPYDDFLRRRRPLMAQLIQRGFEAIGAKTGEGAQLPEGSPEEQNSWRLIESTERQLRQLVRRRFAEQWGGGADAMMRTILGDQAMETVDRNRKKYKSQYAFAVRPVTDPILDFCRLTIGFPSSLMVKNSSR